MAKVFGLSASLRDARSAHEVDHLCGELGQLNTIDDLVDYIKRDTRILNADCIETDFAVEVPFKQIDKEPQRNVGSYGLSNSKAALMAGLLGAMKNGASIDYCSLQAFFPASGYNHNLHLLKQRVLQADALLLSGPVYFGDRSSVAQEFIDFIYSDDQIRAHIFNKIYAGIAVGAKRNGGQETTLVYQLIDMINLNMLAVGNGAKSTAQYGGTVVAGDLDTAANDEYGLNTSFDTGVRISHVASLFEMATEDYCNEPIKIAVIMLQDNKDKKGIKMVHEFCDRIAKKSSHAEFDVLDFSEEYCMRCLACDVCPRKISEHGEYNCIIKNRKDLFVKFHRKLIDYDAILVAAYSPCNRLNVSSVYQRFIERTRYLRRDNYAIGDLLIAPLIFSELNSNQNLHIRISTSMIRHHSIMHHPLIGIFKEDKVIDWEYMLNQGVTFLENVKRLHSAKKNCGSAYKNKWEYNPLGYFTSTKNNNKRR